MFTQHTTDCVEPCVNMVMNRIQNTELWRIEKNEDILLCALSVGSRRNVTRLLAAKNGPESTSWMIILIASPSKEVCRRGASKSSSAGGWNVNVVNWLVFVAVLASTCLSRNAAISGLFDDKWFIWKSSTTIKNRRLQLWTATTHSAILFNKEGRLNFLWARWAFIVCTWFGRSGHPKRWPSWRISATAGRICCGSRGSCRC